MKPPIELPRELVLEYLDDSRRNLRALHAALIAIDCERARVYGHQLKATGRPYGFPYLTTLGTAIEHAATHHDMPGLEHLFHRLQDYLTGIEIAGE